VAVGRRDNTDIDLRRARAAYRFELAFLQHAEQLRLELQRHVPNFVEKQSSTVCEREAADMGCDGTGESTPFVAEKLAFEKAGRHRGAVELDQILPPARAQLLNGTRDDFHALDPP